MEKRDADLLLENFRLALKFIKMNDADHIKCKYDSFFEKLDDLDSSGVVGYWMKIKKLAEGVVTNFDKISINDLYHLHRIKKIVKNCIDLNFFEIVEYLDAGSVTQFDDCLENIGWNSTSQVSVSMDCEIFQYKLSCIQLELQNLFKELPLLESNFYMIFNFILMYLFC